MIRQEHGHGAALTSIVFVCLQPKCCKSPETVEGSLYGGRIYYAMHKLCSMGYETEELGTKCFLVCVISKLVQLEGKSKALRNLLLIHAAVHKTYSISKLHTHTTFQERIQLQ